MKKIINKFIIQTPLLINRHLTLKKGEVLKRFGFTLVEMLVVISIIGILSAFLAGGYVNSQKSAKDAARKINLKSISDALNSYYADNGKYPEVGDLIDSQGAFMSTSDGIIYMKKVPIETGGMESIEYERGSDEKSFRLYTNLENNEDKDCVSSSACALLGYSVTKGCCYIVTSSNIGTTSPLP